MSTEKPTLVRVWKNGYAAEPITAFVDDWNQGHFTVPDDHPFAGLIHERTLLTLAVTVYSTDELEWMIDTIHARSGYGIYHLEFICRPRVKHLRDCLLSDEYLIEVWLNAEKRWIEATTC